MNSGSLALFLNNLYKYLIGLAAVIAVIQIIRGGLEYSTQDSVSAKGEGKKHIQQAILGLVLVLSPALVFYIINPSILNLSLNLPALNTKSGSATGPNGTGNGVTNANGQQIQGGTGKTTTNGCNTPTGGSSYHSVSCDTKDDADNWNNTNCNGGGDVTGGSCKSGGTDANGKCIDGTPNWQVFCPWQSPRNYTFYDISGSDYFGQGTFVPIPNDKSAVDSFVNSCTTHLECFARAIGGVTCPADQSYPKFKPSKDFPTPDCIGAPLLCVDSNEANSTWGACSPAAVLDDGPTNSGG